MDLIEERNEALKKSNLACESLKELSVLKSSTEADYRIALAEKIKELREQGIPATLISDLARGDSQVALLKKLRDRAEDSYKNANTYIDNYKLNARLIDNQIQREWGNG